MRTFIIVSLLATAFADKLGYNYQPGLNAIDAAGSGNIGLVAPIPVTGGLVSSVTQIGTGGLTGLGSGLLNTGSVIGTGGLTGLGSGLLNTGSVIGTGGLIHTGNAVTTSVVDADAILNSVPQTVEYSKQFYHFTAPEEEHHEGVINQQLSNVLKKNLQVVFIKAPENNAATNAALQLAKQAIEQRTAIYVLSKENDASQVVTQLQQIQENVQTSPEVRIVKYRTPQDAAIATEQIQAQYNSVGGSSEVYNGGVAPVLNYASPAAIGTVGILGNGGIGGISGIGHGGIGHIGVGGLGVHGIGVGGVAGYRTPIVGGHGIGNVVSSNTVSYLPPAIK